jgi:intein/homing endonuclease
MLGLEPGPALLSVATEALAEEKSLGCTLCGAEFRNGRQLSGHFAGKHVPHLGRKRIRIRVEHLTETQKAYLAAFLDGEGGIQITRNLRKNRIYKLALHPTVYFTNTNFEAINVIKHWISSGPIVHRKEKGNHRDTFVVNVSGTGNVVTLLTILAPYMIIKRAQARVMIEYCQNRLTHYAGNDRRFSRRELQLYTALRKLNKKGR